MAAIACSPAFAPCGPNSNAHAARSGAKSAKEWLQRAKLKEGEVRKGLRADLLTTKTIDALMGHAKLTGAGAAQK